MRSKIVESAEKRQGYIYDFMNGTFLKYNVFTEFVNPIIQCEHSCWGRLCFAVKFLSYKPDSFKEIRQRMTTSVTGTVVG